MRDTLLNREPAVRGLGIAMRGQPDRNRQRLQFTGRWFKKKPAGIGVAAG